MRTICAKSVNTSLLLRRINFNQRCLSQYAVLNQFYKNNNDFHKNIDSKFSHSIRSYSEMTNQKQDRNSRGFFFKSLFGMSLLASGVLVGCYLNEDFRVLIESNVPYSREALTYVFDSVDPYIKTSPQKPLSIPQKTSPIDKNLNFNIRNVSPEPITTKPSKVTESPKPEIKQGSVKTSQEIRTDEDIILATKNLESITEELKKKIYTKVEDLEKHLETLKKLANQKCSVAIENFSKISKMADDCRQSIREASLLESHNRDKILSNAHTVLTSVRNLAESTVALFLDAESTLHEMSHYIDEASKDNALRTCAVYRDAVASYDELAYNLGRSQILAQKSQDDLVLSVRYKDILLGDTSAVSEEINRLLSDLKSSANKSNDLAREELVVLLTSVYQGIDTVLEKLAAKEDNNRKRILSVFKEQRKSDEKIANRLTELELNRVLAKDQIKKIQQEEEFRDNHKLEIEEVLAMQVAANIDRLKLALRLQRDLLEKETLLKIRESLMTDRTEYLKWVQVWNYHVLGIEAVIDGRANDEKDFSRGQQLGLLTQALLESIDDEVVNKSHSIEARSYDKPKKPLKEMAEKIVNLASEKHEDSFIVSLAENIPNLALERGVFSQQQLTNRFSKVKRICRRVAMLDESGGSLFAFMLSWFQSVLILEPFSVLSAEDDLSESSLKHYVISPFFNVNSSLNHQRQNDTFILLASAEHALLNNDLELATRFVSSIKGLAGLVASDWLAESRLLLESRIFVRSIRTAALARSICGY